MSQILNTGGGGGGSGLETLTGNTGGPVSPTAGNIDVVGDGVFLTVDGDPGTSTLTISPLNQTEYTLTTNDDTPTDLITFPVALNSCYSFAINIVAVQDTFAAGAGGTITASVRRAGAGTISIGAATYSIPEDFGGTFDVTATVSGNNFLVTVTGLAATTIFWKAHLTLVEL